MKPPVLKLTREEDAQAEMSRTSIARPVAAALVALFLALIYAVPVIQAVDEWQQYRLKQRSSPRPQCLELADGLHEAAAIYARAEGRWYRRVTAANEHATAFLKAYEGRLERQSWLTRRLRSPAQWVLTRFGGVGNDKVYRGRDAWVYYKPDVETITGRGFLDARSRGGVARFKVSDASADHSDPVAVIVEFDGMLRQQGIRLIVLPVPTKPMIEPEALTGGGADAPNILCNRSYAEFLRRLERQNVEVLDPLPLLREYRAVTGRPAYLAGDTHWRPDAMETVARALAERIRALGVLPDVSPIAYRRQRLAVAALGDTVAMLNLPASQSLFPLEWVDLRQVLTPEGRPWACVEAADVLLLGDSFANIYSQPSLGWGGGAGLAEQMSYYLQRPVDRLVRNDNGAYATRQALAESMAAGRDPLAGKRVVIWEFTQRELALGQWKAWHELVGGGP